MPSSTFLLHVWVPMALVALTLDMTMLYLRWTGKRGRRRRDRARENAAVIGGLRNLVLFEAVVALLVPPVMIAACLITSYVGR
jgi:hypothetical protein